MNRKLTYIILIGILALPVGVFAVDLPAAPAGGIIDFKNLIDNVINFIWPLFLGFSTLMFIIAGFKFLSSLGNPSDLQEARRFVIWGMVGVGVAILAFSIPTIIGNVIGAGI